MYYPEKKEFTGLTKRGNVIPVYAEIPADSNTPLSAFLKIDDNKNSFLFESIEGGEKIGRYSFLSSNPSVVIESKGSVVKIIEKGKAVRKSATNPFDDINKFMRGFKFVKVKGLPRFCGGLVGFMGYDLIRFIENIPDTCKNDLGLPDLRLMLADTLLVFDRVSHTIKVVSNAHIKSSVNSSIDRAYKDAIKKIDSLIIKLKKPLRKNLEPIKKEAKPIKFKSNIRRIDFEKSALKAKEYIKAGDIIQVVLSQRLETVYNKNPIDVYRALCLVNPSPYMFYISFKDFKLVGSSPEIMVRGEDGIAEVRPIAGTRPRGKDEKADKLLEKELLSDEKERAEHLMLVDLGRNDLGRVCVPGSVRINEFMVIERYSHVMHIVSDCVGRLLPGSNALSLLKASFPAGTVAGAPKIRAMEIIDELETTKRGPYAGCVGYLSFSGNLDTCITIRTILLKHNKAYIQAGAGIVADSIPAKEYQESINKAKGMLKAVAIARQAGLPAGRQVI
jgi:anthranilate synthase component 1